jgi:DNA-binding Xre family transcriptional regulator
MTRKLGYRWRLRELMAERGMYQTTDLVPLLAERGVVLSSVQVYRLVTQTPERLNLRTLMALCDILGCSSVELVEPVAEATPKRKAAGGRPGQGGVGRGLRPTRARIARQSER